MVVEGAGGGKEAGGDILRQGGWGGKPVEGRQREGREWWEGSDLCWILAPFQGPKGAVHC